MKTRVKSMPGMPEGTVPEALYDEAFQISRVLHHDDLTATRIASTALAKLPYAADRQARRFYYDTEDSSRTRSYADGSLLLTRLVLAESTEYERREEATGRIDPQLFQVRVVKQLVASSLKRNSFYATVAIARILHDYSTNTVMGLYAHLAPHRSEKKESSHYRRAKAVLMEELSDRFGPLLTLEYGPDGRRFAAERAADEALINKALALFAPRRIQHTPPAQFEADNQRHWRRSGTEAWSDELKRLHMLIDPACFRQLLKLAVTDGWYGFRSRSDLPDLTDHRLVVPRLNQPDQPDEGPRF